MVIQTACSKRSDVETRRKSGMAVPQSSDPSANLLLNLIDGHRVTAVIHTAARLGIADFLLESPKTAAELAGLTVQEHFANAAKKSAGLFNEAMVSITRMAVSDLLAAYDFSGIETLMDVGGGLGELMIGILKEYPSMRGVVFDLPLSSEKAKKNISDAGVADRCEFSPGDFFESVPSGADAVIMKSIIHDWNDERCAKILQNCRRVLAPSARLILVDKVLPEKIESGLGDLFVFLDDLNMLQGPGGCERTPAEFRALLAKGGFRMQRVVPSGRYNVIEATAF
jgi:ubiquinone/menaquinone biosynthesis C-methylase UbiE